MEEIYSVNHKLPESLIRSICGIMMFGGDNAKKKIALLSGGEKSRVMLAKIIAKDVNLLFLDEPTNHLDIDSIDSLTKAIKAFKGSCIIVTHSEQLLRAVCDKLIVFTNEGAEYFNGDYDEFLTKVGWEEEEGIQKKKVVKPKRNKKEIKKLRALLVTEKSKLAFPIKQEISQIEALSTADKAKKQSRLKDLEKDLERLTIEFEKKLNDV